MKAQSLVITLILILLLAPSPATSQEEAARVIEKHLTTFEHIPSPTFGRVSCVLRDDRGFLWFGTTRGLCRYDGYEARVFPNGPSLNMKQQNITAIMRLDNRTLLIGTARGVWIFNLETKEFAPFVAAHQLSEKGITALARDTGGVIWIGTESFGLFRYDPTTDSLQQYSTVTGLSHNYVRSLFIDPSGKLWVGTDLGLNTFEPTTALVLPYSRGETSKRLASHFIVSLYGKDPDELWVGTTAGLYVLKSSSGEVRRLPLPSPIVHTVSSITSDPSGRMWIATADLGLLSYVNGKFRLFTTLHDPGRTLSTIRVLYPDPVAANGANLFLWVGTRTGISKVILSQNPFTSHIRNQDGLKLNRGAVLTLREDRSGMLWVGLWGGGLNGLRKIDGEYRRVAIFEKTASTPNALPNNDVGKLCEDRKGRLWVGTANGLALFDRQRNLPMILRHLKGDATGILDNRITSIHEDRAGTMWVATRGGLSELLPGEQIRFRHHFHTPADAHPVGGNVISSVIEDHSSRLWVGTFGRGLFRRNTDGSFTHFFHPGDSLGMHENWVYTLTEGRKGNFWLSTISGLVSFDPRTGDFVRYPTSHPLQDAHIFGIAEDRRGDLWLSTSIGLVKFSPQTKAFLRMNAEHGFPFIELRSGFFRDPREKLLVGGLDGFAEFDPDSVSPISGPPAVAVTSFAVFDQELSSSVYGQRDIHLSHDQNFFSFSFAALDYFNPPQNRFAYKMEGVDKDWVEAGTRNYASYTNLDPGKYVFHVKGANSANVWNETGTFLTIIISPPYWETWWFRTLIVVIIVGAVYAGYRYRLRRALEVERMRLRIADDLHDDVGSNLSTIAMVSRVVQRAPELSSGTRNKLAEIYDTAIRTSEGMKDIVWFIKPKDDTIEDLLLRMKDTASGLLADIRHDFHAPKNGSSERVTIEFKRNFFLAFKEILTNIQKHASATDVQIRVEQRANLLEAVISDNGKGFDEFTVRRGNGLGSLQARAQHIGGLCEVVSMPGKGTTVKFSGTF